MDFKTIFSEGKNEWQRRRSISKDNSNLKSQQSLLTERMGQLGQQAWADRIDMTGFPIIQEALAGLQNQLDELRGQDEACQKKRLAEEDQKTLKNEEFAREKATLDAQKKETDDRLGREKEQLKSLQKDLSLAEGRSAQISRERENLQKKITDATTSTQDRSQHETRLGELSGEEPGLLDKRRSLSEAIQSQNERVAPLQRESEDLARKVSDLLSRQKEAIGAIDKKLAELRKESDLLATKAKDLDKLQLEQFRLLGEGLAAAGSVEPALAEKLGAVRETEQAIGQINHNIAQLDSQQNEVSSQAYRQMMMIIIGGVLLVAALIITAVILLKPKPKNAVEAMLETGNINVEALGKIIAKSGTDAGELKKNAEDFQKGLGALKTSSEQKMGADAPVASEKDLKPVLSVVSGWQMETPIYSKMNFSGIESSSLRTKYSRDTGDEIQAEITDTHSISILLAPSQALFSMNMTVDDELVYQKTGQLDGIPMIESLEKRTGTARLNLVIAERYLLNLDTQSENGLDLLKSFVGSLNLAGLK